jgi:type IV pilus assembly protein PilY1
MKRYSFITSVFMSALFLFIFRPAVFAASMNDYCQIPPFVASVTSPNILFLNDVSGSMSFCAYYPNARSGYACDCDPAVTAGCVDAGYNNQTLYEGYFNPAKQYTKGADNVYRESVSTTCNVQCDQWQCMSGPRNCGDTNQVLGSGYGAGGCTSRNKTYGCCQHGTTTGCNPQSGNFLNYVHMHRIDILRWALTGGAPQSCSGSNTFNPAYCDPEEWNLSGNSGKVGAVCNNSIAVSDDGTVTGGCILQADDNTLVAAPWSRVYAGLAFQFETLPILPRMGAMFFENGSGTDGSSDVRSHKVYCGDFLSSNSNSAQFPFQNLITYMNTQDPNGGTATGPAMWDALNYYAQNPPQFGGFTAMSNSTGDYWRNPLYWCDGNGGNNCTYLPCVRNFVILTSDGEWNQDGDSSNCFIGSPADAYPPSSWSSATPDPVVPAYEMHKGFTNSATNFATKVSGVYTVGLFMNNAASPWGTNAMKNVAMYGSFDYNSTSQRWPDSLTGFPTASCCTDDTLSGDCGNCVIHSNLNASVQTNAQGSVCAALPASSQDWDKNADGVPDTFYQGNDAVQLKQSILNAVMDILAKTTSGTAASVLASGEGSGANLVQATYYPRRQFYDTAISWVGGLQNFWYYVDPMFSNSEIREEGQPRDYILDLLAPSGDSNPAHHDYILTFYYDTNQQKAMAERSYDQVGNGSPTTPNFDTVDFDNLGNLWEAGKSLWGMAASSRNIYTPLDTTQALTASANQFSTANLSALRPLLNTDASTSTVTATQTTENNQLATNIINWVAGTDLAPYTFSAGTDTYRSRTVALSSTSGTGVWKLGDIVDSTPRIVSWMKLNNYDQIYKDDSYAAFTTDVGDVASTLPATSTARYKNRGMVFVGANDGMIHAFKLGRLGLQWPSRAATQQATLKYCSNSPSTACGVDSDCSGGTCTADTDLGTEKWAFIPKSALPYLQYLADPSYCHLFMVDLTPYVVDASINIDTTASGQTANCTSSSYSNYWECKRSADSWRTILIGGMKYGGSCKAPDATCSTDYPNGVCAPATVGGTALGYSSYFALDITDPYNPKFLWEFTNPNLGFASTGPSVVRISSKTVSGGSSMPDPTTDGRWFVVFGSGPTGGIDTVNHQFMGNSDQDLRLFILDLKTGQLLRTIDTTIPYAFAGSMVIGTQDINPPQLNGGINRYQDDAVYLGYTKKCTDSTHPCTSNTWTDGGILRLLTNADMPGANLDTNPADACVFSGASQMTALNPNCWVFGQVMDGIGPVTAAVAHLENYGANELWLFTGTGRYFYKTNASTDDADAQRHLIGVKDPCFSGGTTGVQYLPACLDSTTSNDPAVLGLGDLTTVNLSSVSGVSSATNGWDILLNGSASGLKAERVITDPLAASSGVVFFTTYKPYTDQCASGGKTALWALLYNNGGSAAAAGMLQGKAIIQVSTGSIEQIDLASAFKLQGQRKSADIEGVPPTAQGLSVVVGPPPQKKVLHMMER